MHRTLQILPVVLGSLFLAAGALGAPTEGWDFDLDAPYGTLNGGVLRVNVNVMNRSTNEKNGGKASAWLYWEVRCSTDEKRDYLRTRGQEQIRDLRNGGRDRVGLEADIRGAKTCKVEMRITPPPPNTDHTFDRESLTVSRR